MLFTQKWYSQNNLVLHLGSSSLSWVCIPLSTWLMDEDDKGEYINNDNEWSIIRWMEKWSNWTELMAHGRGAVEIKGMCIIELSVEGEVGGGIQWKAKMLMHLMQFGLSPISLHLTPYKCQSKTTPTPLNSCIPLFLAFFLSIISEERGCDCECECEHDCGPNQNPLMYLTMSLW